MPKPKLFLDMDGVVMDTVLAIATLYNKRFLHHPNFKYAIASNCTKWDMKDICPLITNIEEIFYDRELFNELKPFQNAIEVIKELQGKYQIIIVTIGHKENIRMKINWIDTYLPFVDDIIGIVNKSCVMNKSIINMEGTEGVPNIFIDDSASNLFSQNNTRNLVRYCYGAKRTDWNKDWLNQGGRHLKDWNEVKNELLKEEEY